MDNVWYFDDSEVHALEGLSLLHLCNGHYQQLPALCYGLGKRDGLCSKMDQTMFQCSNALFSGSVFQESERAEQYLGPGEVLHVIEQRYLLINRHICLFNTGSA